MYFLYTVLYIYIYICITESLFCTPETTQHCKLTILQLKNKIKNKQTKKNNRDFPGGSVVGNPPANAGDTGSSPGPGGSHMPRSDWARVPRLLSLRSGAREPQLLSPCSTTREATARRGSHTAMKSGPRSPQSEEAHE